MNLALLSSGGSGSAGMMVMIVYIVIIFGAMYFFAIRPQKKEQKRMNALLSTMEIGDTVVTTSGFYGTVIAVSEDDCIVEFGNNRNCRIPMRKSAIVEIEKAQDGVADASAPAEKDTRSDKSKDKDKSKK